MKNKMNIRKIQVSDLQFLNAVRNEYAKEFLHDSRTFTLEESVKWFVVNNPEYYIIEHNEEKIGYFRLSNYSKENNNIYAGIDICKEFKGKGLSSMAWKIFIPFLFEKYKLNKISVEILKTNVVSFGMCTKAGFIYEGEKREDILKNGVYVNSIIMSILKKEYNS